MTLAVDVKHNVLTWSGGGGQMFGVGQTFASGHNSCSPHIGEKHLCFFLVGARFA